MLLLSTARLTHNAYADRRSVPKAGMSDPAFHPSLPDFATTPLRSAPKAAQRLGVRSVLVKDESQRLGMPSFKILGASWATYRTVMAHLGLAVGAEPTLDHLREAVAACGSELTLVAATDGNHGRAVARMAKLLGLGAIIVVPAGTVDSRIDAITGEGAEVRIVDGGYDEAIAAGAALSDDTHVVISDTSWEGYTDTPGWVIDGYSTMLTEIVDEIDGGHVAEPTVVAAQIGVGAFAADQGRLHHHERGGWQDHDDRRAAGLDHGRSELWHPVDRGVGRRPARLRRLRHGHRRRRTGRHTAPP